MTAPMISLRDLPRFNRTWPRAAAAGAGAGLLLATLPPPAGALAFAIPFAAVVSSFRSFNAATLVLVSIGAALSIFATVLAIGSGSWLFCGASVAIGILLCARGRAEDTDRPSFWAYAATASSGAALLQLVMTTIGDAAALSFARHTFAVAIGRASFLGPPAGANDILQTAVGGAVLALCGAIATLPAHLGRERSALERGRTALMAQMKGQFLALAFETRKLFDCCLDAVNGLERLDGKGALIQTLERIALDNLTVCAHWSQLDERLSEVSRAELAARCSTLEQAAAAASDPIVQRQLAAQLQLCREQTEQLTSFATRRDRAVERIRSQLALLERARLSLWMASLGDVAQQLADGEQLARTLEGLSEGPRHEGEARADLAEPLRVA